MRCLFQTSLKNSATGLSFFSRPILLNNFGSNRKCVVTIMYFIVDIIENCFEKKLDWFYVSSFCLHPFSGNWPLLSNLLFRDAKSLSRSFWALPFLIKILNLTIYLLSFDFVFWIDFFFNAKILSLIGSMFCKCCSYAINHYRNLNNLTIIFCIIRSHKIQHRTTSCSFNIWKYGSWTSWNSSNHSSKLEEIIFSGMV